MGEIVVAGMTAHVLRERLEALHDDLGSAAAGEACSAAIARVFNALLSEAREQLGDDQIVKSIHPIWPIDDESDLPSLASVQVLAGQLRAALGPRSPRGPATSHAPRVTSEVA
jgi:hypothetical protein